jgi:hypothetical protein
MKNRKSADTILWIEAMGFLAIITLSWLDELVNLPRRLFGAPLPVNWPEAVIETTVVLLAWLVVHRVTTRLLKRLHYLEEFFRVCAWCRKIDAEGEWVPLEEYFSRTFATKTSHGMCPECARQLEAKLRDLPGGA